MNRQPCPSEVRGEASINTVHRHALQDWPKPVKLPVPESLFLQMMKVNDGEEMFKAQSDISGISPSASSLSKPMKDLSKRGTSSLGDDARATSVSLQQSK